MTSTGDSLFPSKTKNEKKNKLSDIPLFPPPPPHLVGIIVCYRSKVSPQTVTRIGARKTSTVSTVLKTQDLRVQAMGTLSPLFSTIISYQLKGGFSYWLKTDVNFSNLLVFSCIDSQNFDQFSDPRGLSLHESFPAFITARVFPPKSWLAQRAQLRSWSRFQKIEQENVKDEKINALSNLTFKSSKLRRNLILATKNFEQMPTVEICKTATETPRMAKKTALDCKIVSQLQNRYFETGMLITTPSGQ